MWGAGTLDAWTPNCRISRPLRHLKLVVGIWPSIPDTSGMNTGHVRYDQDSEPSKTVKVETSELPTLAGTPDEPTREQHFYSYWANTGHVRYCQTSKNKVGSFVAQILQTHMGWLEHLWNIIYQHDASLLIVRHSYLLKFKSITNLNLLSWSISTEVVYSNLHQVRVPTYWYWSFHLSIAILSTWLDSIHQIWIIPNVSSHFHQKLQ